MVRAARARIPEHAGGAEQARPGPGLLALLGQLGLGQLQLLMDQPARLLRQLLEQLPERPLPQVARLGAARLGVGRLITGCHHKPPLTGPVAPAGRGRSGRGQPAWGWSRAARPAPRSRPPAHRPPGPPARQPGGARTPAGPPCRSGSWSGWLGSAGCWTPTGTGRRQTPAPARRPPRPRAGGGPSPPHRAGSARRWPP